MQTSLRKVECVMCNSTFKVREDPPVDLIEPRFDLTNKPLDPFAASVLTFMKNGAAVEYCQQNCPYCKDSIDATKWDYRIEVLEFSEQSENPVDDAQGFLNGLGGLGWELISVTPGVGRGNSYTFAYFKRPKPD